MSEHHRLTKDPSDQRSDNEKKKGLKIKTIFFFSPLEISGTDT
jgi:hypothetical protein